MNSPRDLSVSDVLVLASLLGVEPPHPFEVSKAGQVLLALSREDGGRAMCRPLALVTEALDTTRSTVGEDVKFDAHRTQVRTDFSESATKTVSHTESTDAYLDGDGHGESEVITTERTLISTSFGDTSVIRESIERAVC